MKEIFVPQRFAAKSENLLRQIFPILESYAAQGFSLSIRQLYYQLVSRNIIANKHQEYKRIIALVSDARLAGRIDWDAIVDRARVATRPRNWKSASDAVRWVHEQFQIDKWEHQSWHVEVMVEKQALEGVIEPICNELDVTFTANKGYSSQTMLYEAGKRMANYIGSGKKILLCYLGDHDPSGIDMTRDVRERVEMFSRTDTLIRVERLALNMNQVEQYNPPENPAKQTDSRTQGYINLYGESSWELDALEPSVLAALLSTAILSVRDQQLWEEACEKETSMRKKIEDAVDKLEGKRKRKKTTAKKRSKSKKKAKKK